MIKGRKRMFDDRFGETIGTFLDYSQSASLSYKDADTLFNSFASPNKYREGLNQMYERAKDDIEVEVAHTEDNYQKSLFIGHVLTETTAALALLGKDKEGNFTHKNFPGIDSERKTVNEADYQDFYYWSDHFLRKMLTFLESIMESVGRINPPVNINNKPADNVTIKHSYKIIAVASKKQLATSLFNKLVKEGCLTESSMADFVNAFTGEPPANKIKWIGDFGDLKSLINWSIELKFIKDVKNKWVIAASIFTDNGVVITNKTIKDTHKTNNDGHIKTLVNSTKSLRP